MKKEKQEEKAEVFDLSKREKPLGLESIEEYGVPAGPGESGQGNDHAIHLRELQERWAEEQYARERAEIAAANRIASESHERRSTEGYNPQFDTYYSDRKLDTASTAHATEHDLHMGDPATKAGDEGHPEK
jgi:hypothetical protein